MVPRLIAVAAIVLASITPAAASTPGESDLQLFKNIQRRVLEYPHYTVFDTVSAQIDGGVVTLTGKVTMPYKRQDIERRVTGLDGVLEVRNQIDVLPASKSDDELRLAIARAIYADPTFRRSASLVNPPIHVIVERGRVTLQGVVLNAGDRLLVQSIARSFDAFHVKDELKTEAEAKEDLE